ncbi:MAG: hypothetical protein RSC56_08025 [Acidaminococcaceae bacterium]
MEFFIFLIFMSFVSFAIAFVAYAFVVWMFGTTSTVSRYAQMFLIPLSIVGYDFVTITAPLEYRYVVGGAPMLMIGLILLYYRFGRGGTFNDAPEPLEVHKPSVKSLRHAEKKNKRKQGK